MGDGPQDAAAAVAAYEGVGSGLLGQLLATQQMRASLDGPMRELMEAALAKQELLSLTFYQAYV